MARKLIIDLDPGIGDAFAAVVALLDPELDVLALTATSGCVSGAAATRNLQSIVAQVDPPRWPRIGQASDEDIGRERIVPPSYATLDFLNGPEGLGECDFNVAELHHLRDSAKLLIETVKANPHEVTLLTLGPLTNVAAAMDRDPEFLSLLDGLVCLAGSIAEGGDVTSAAEFNVFTSPEAARTVLRAQDPKIIIPLDVTNRAVLTYDAFNRLMEGPLKCGEFLQKLLPYSVRAHHQHLGVEGLILREVTALVAVTRPQLFRMQRMAVDVETQGDVARGATLFDRRRFFQCPTNATVAMEVDVQAVQDHLTRLLRDRG